MPQQEPDSSSSSPPSSSQAHKRTGDSARLLYDLSVISTWSPDEDVPSNVLALDPTLSILSKDTSNLVTSHNSFLSNFTNTLARSLGRLNFSTTVPPAILHRVPELRSEWLLEVSPDGRWLVIATEARIEVRSKESDFVRVHSEYVPGKRERYPRWRELAWSPDSRVFAVSGSDGRVDVLDTEGTVVSSISQAFGGINASTEKDSEAPVSADGSSAKGSRKDFLAEKANVFMLEPIAFVAFVDTVENAKNALKESKGVDEESHPYLCTYRLIIVNYSSNLRSYNIRVTEDKRSNSTASSPVSPGASPTDVSTSKACKRSYSLKLSHRFSFKPWHAVVCCGAFESTSKTLVIGGKGVEASNDADQEGAAPTNISFWRISSEAPYFHNLSSDAVVDPKTAYLKTEDDRPWTRFRNAVSTWRKHTEDFAEDVAHMAVFSRNGRRLLSLDVSGRLTLWKIDLTAKRKSHIEKIWQSNELAYLGRGPDYEALSMVEFAELQAGMDPAAKDSRRCVGVKWWSDDQAVLVFNDGQFSVVSLTDLTSSIGGSIEKFDVEGGYCLSLTSTHNGQLHLLERDVHYLRARVVAGGKIVNVRPICDAEDGTADDLDPLDPPIEQPSISGRLISSAINLVHGAASIFLWHFDKEPKITAQTIRLPRRTFRLVRFASTTPEELLRRRIDGKEYDESLKLAEEFELNPDPVHKAIWNESQVSWKNINNHLDKITDRIWVLNACLDRIPSSAVSSRDLLEYGLQHTDCLSQLKNYVDQQYSALFEIDGKAPNSIPSEAFKSITYLPEDLLLLCEYRLVFLKYLDRLNTYLATEATLTADHLKSNGSASSLPVTGFTAQGYAQFRDMNVVAIAAEFAKHQRVEGLHCLFTRHGKDTLPFRFSILDQIPETFPPDHYDPLLPFPDQSQPDLESRWSERRWRENEDWVEHPTLKTMVGWIDDGANQALETLGLTSRTYPGAASEVTQWYTARARSIDSLSGQAAHALSLITNGVSLGVPHLSEIKSRLDILNDLVYKTLPASFEFGTSLTLQQLETMGCDQIFRIFLTETTSKSVVDDVRNSAIPALRSLNRLVGCPSDPMEIFYTWLLELPASGNLDWCMHVSESSALTLPESRRIIPSIATSRALSLSWAYGHARMADDDWNNLRRILSSVKSEEKTPDAGIEKGFRRPSGSAGGTRSNPSKLKIISRTDIPVPSLNSLEPSVLFQYYKNLKDATINAALDGFAMHLSANETLLRYDCQVVLSWYLHSAESHSMQKNLVTRLTRQLSGQDLLGSDYRRTSDKDWSRLLEDILLLHNDGKGIIGLVDVQDIVADYMAGLLANAKFRLAKEVLFPSNGAPPLSPERTEEIVFAAAQEFFDNANSGNEYSAYAEQCIKILPQFSERLRTELDLISATQTLMRAGVYHKPGMAILPIQVRLTQDKPILVTRYVETTPRAYLNPSAALDLLAKLGHAKDASAESRVYAKLVRAAVKDKQYPIAADLCDGLVKITRRSKPTGKQNQRATPSSLEDGVLDETYKVLVHLAEQDAYDDLVRRTRLASMALMHCSADEQSDTLELWRSLNGRRRRAEVGHTGFTPDKSPARPSATPFSSLNAGALRKRTGGNSFGSVTSQSSSGDFNPIFSKLQSVFF